MRCVTMGAILASVSMVLPSAHAQCTPDWIAGTPGLQSFVLSLGEWDPDGGGPQGEVLVLGGTLFVPGPAGYGLATWDGSTYTMRGTFAGAVRAQAVMPDGDLVVGGDFSSLTVGGTSVAGTSMLARYDVDTGTWSGIGGGVTAGATVQALAVMPDGTLIAGGVFTHVGGVAARCVAAWNGSAWSALGGGLNFNPPLGAGDVNVRGLATLADGTVAVGGYFDLAGGQGVEHVARWNGSSWSAMGMGFPSIALSGTVSRGVTTMGRSANGARIVVGVAYTLAPTFPQLHGSVAEWDGDSWEWLGAGWGNGFVGSLRSVAPGLGGEVYLGGGFNYAGGNNIARWDGATWSGLDGGANGGVEALCVRTTGEAVAGGTFGVVGGVGGTPTVAWARWGGCPVCDSVDFNGDGVFPDNQDIIDFLEVFAGAPCPTGACADLDFNNDGVFPDNADVSSLIAVFAGGSC